MNAESLNAVVLLTGTSSGIGLQTAVELARRGLRVFASMRATTRSGALLSAANEAGVEVEVLALDVASEASVQAAVHHVVSVAGRLDVVVNNAAQIVYAPVEFTPLDSVTAMLDVDSAGPIRVIQSALPIMRRQGSGRIVNVGSVGAEPRYGMCLLGVYGMTKAALRALTLELNKELAPLGIRVVLCKGGISGRAVAPMAAIVDGVADFGPARGRTPCPRGAPELSPPCLRRPRPTPLWRRASSPMLARCPTFASVMRATGNDWSTLPQAPTTTTSFGSAPMTTSLRSSGGMSSDRHPGSWANSGQFVLCCSGFGAAVASSGSCSFLASPYEGRMTST